MISLRPATPDDREFVLAVCRAAMSEYHRIARGWDDAQIEAAFLRHLDLPHTQIILFENKPVGILTLLHGPRADWITRIGLLPSTQGKGVGTSVLQKLQGNGRPLRLTVYKCNPSQKLYQKLGFEVTRETEIELEMLWHPQQP